MIKHIKRLLNWLQTTGEQYRQETKAKEAWPFPVGHEPKLVSKKPTLKKATTRKVVAKKVVKAKKK
jgi:hypothetical protein